MTARPAHFDMFEGVSPLNEDSQKAYRGYFETITSDELELAQATFRARTYGFYAHHIQALPQGIDLSHTIKRLERISQTFPSIDTAIETILSLRLQIQDLDTILDLLESHRLTVDDLLFAPEWLIEDLAFVNLAHSAFSSQELIAFESRIKNSDDLDSLTQAKITPEEFARVPTEVDAQTYAQWKTHARVEPEDLAIIYKYQPAGYTKLDGNGHEYADLLRILEANNPEIAHAFLERDSKAVVLSEDIAAITRHLEPQKETLLGIKLVLQKKAPHVLKAMSESEAHTCLEHCLAKGADPEKLVAALLEYAEQLMRVPLNKISTQLTHYLEMGFCESIAIGLASHLPSSTPQAWKPLLELPVEEQKASIKIVIACPWMKLITEQKTVRTHCGFKTGWRGARIAKYKNVKKRMTEKTSAVMKIEAARYLHRLGLSPQDASAWDWDHYKAMQSHVESNPDDQDYPLTYSKLLSCGKSCPKKPPTPKVIQACIDSLIDENISVDLAIRYILISGLSFAGAAKKIPNTSPANIENPPLKKIAGIKELPKGLNPQQKVRLIKYQELYKHNAQWLSRILDETYPIEKTLQLYEYCTQYTHREVKKTTLPYLKEKNLKRIFAAIDGLTKSEMSLFTIQSLHSELGHIDYTYFAVKRGCIPPLTLEEKEELIYEFHKDTSSAYFHPAMDLAFWGDELENIIRDVDFIAEAKCYLHAYPKALIEKTFHEGASNIVELVGLISAEQVPMAIAVEAWTKDPDCSFRTISDDYHGQRIQSPNPPTFIRKNKVNDQGVSLEVFRRARTIIPQVHVRTVASCLDNGDRELKTLHEVNDWKRKNKNQENRQRKYSTAKQLPEKPFSMTEAEYNTWLLQFDANEDLRAYHFFVKEELKKLRPALTINIIIWCAKYYGRRIPGKTLAHLISIDYQKSVYRTDYQSFGSYAAIGLIIYTYCPELTLRELGLLCFICKSTQQDPHNVLKLYQWSHNNKQIPEADRVLRYINASDYYIESDGIIKAQRCIQRQLHASLSRQTRAY